MLTRAHEAAYAQKLTFGDEITSMLRLARRDKFRIEESKRITQEIELQTYLNELIERDVDSKVAGMLVRSICFCGFLLKVEKRFQLFRTALKRQTMIRQTIKCKQSRQTDWLKRKS